MDGQVCITNTGTHDTRGLAGTIDLTAPQDTTPITTTALDVSTEQQAGSAGAAARPAEASDFPVQDLSRSPYRHLQASPATLRGAQHQFERLA